MTSGLPWSSKTRSRASRTRRRQRAPGRSCEAPPHMRTSGTAGALRSAPVDRRFRLHHFVDIVGAVPDLAQDRDAVAAQERGRAVVIAAAGGKPVGKSHVDDLAFGRVVNLAEKFRIGEMLVGYQAFKRMHAAGRDVG